MITFPNCKINIGLNVVEKRKDGYHNIETVFYPVPWCDSLEIIPSRKLTFSSSGIKIPPSSRGNLCLLAYQLLAKDFRLPQVQIHLHKNIPVGAGLGGGSSNAAFTLKMLNEMFELKLGRKKLLHYAAQLGSDCPFFILNQPVFAKGRGEVMRKISMDLSKYNIVIIYPPVAVSTAEAYAGVVPGKAKQSLKRVIQHAPVRSWKKKVSNDFEKTIFRKHPSLEKIKNVLYDNGAVYASMSGSGSAVYGIFSLSASEKSFNFPGCRAWMGKAVKA